jgi:hypothetical protein
MTPETPKIFPPKNAASAPPLAAPFDIKETRLLGQLGLSRDALRALRVAHLTEGVHWRQVQRRIMLNAAGVALITEAARLSPAELPPLSPETPRLLLTFPGYPDGTTAIVKAWRGYPKLANRTILEAYLRGTDPSLRRNIVRVRVADSANFVQHMEVPVRLIHAPDLYECTRPAPRSRGRW